MIEKFELMESGIFRDVPLPKIAKNVVDKKFDEILFIMNRRIVFVWIPKKEERLCFVKNMNYLGYSLKERYTDE